MYRSLKSILFVGFILLQACSVFNPEEDIPAYITIDSFQVNTNYPTEGTNKHKITDAWVFINDQPVGTYELPATFPVLNNGQVNLKVFAGIKLNGISSTRVEYPFFLAYENDTNFSLFPDSATLVKPQVSYFPTTQFTWLEDFEDTQFSIDTTNQSNVKIERTTEDSEVFEGNGSAHIKIENDAHVFEGKSAESFVLPKNGFDVYLEMHYKNNIEFQVSVRSNTPLGVRTDPMLILRSTGNEIATAGWKKVYINIQPIIVANLNAFSYELVFNASKPDSVDVGEIFIDNLKLVHPQ